MPLPERNPNNNTTPATGYPIARSFALVVLAALIILVILRHVFGSVNITVGTR